MFIEDYSVVHEGTPEEDCEITKRRFAKRDLIGATILEIKKDEIIIEVVDTRLLQVLPSGKAIPGRVHIAICGDPFSYTTCEGGKA